MISQSLFSRKNIIKSCVSEQNFIDYIEKLPFMSFFYIIYMFLLGNSMVVQLTWFCFGYQQQCNKEVMM